MPASPTQVVVAGHICLDIIPQFAGRDGGLERLLVPGTLVEVGPAVLATGGAVSNTGLALHRLGVPTRLMGRIGADLFGQAIRRIVGAYGPDLADGMLVAPGEPSSYTVVVNPPGVDRIFLHCPGVNDTFGAADIPYAELEGVPIFHFGYPPIMRRIYADGGRELEAIFRQVKARGAVTSLDMAMPDAAGPAGAVDWPRLLARALPHVDLYLPSLEETLFMLDRPRFERLRAAGGVLAGCDGALLARLADTLLGMGTAVVGLKLGDRGLYLRTAADPRRLAALRPATRAALDAWAGRELLAPCFQVAVAGTTGCGDCTIAGFLTGLLHGLTLEQTLTAAVAVGACNVEQPDAVSGVPGWADVQARIARGWPRRPARIDWPGWRWAADGALAAGPNDAASA